MGPIKIHPGLRNSSKVATLLRSTSGSTTKRCTSSPYSTGFAEGSTAVQKNDGAILSPKEDLKQEPHSQGSQALPNDLSAKAVVEMGNRLNEFRERGRYKLWVEPYEKAVANGYVGPYEIWKLSKHPSVLHKRTTGASPYITTLKKLERCPLPEELIRTTSDRNRHRFARNVIVENQVVGMAVFHIAPKGEREPWKPIWVRPYFDHEAKHLRFQLPDGSDHAYSKSLTELANSAARPILYLAYNEGLIDLVPDNRLQSLKFDVVRRSGYAIHSNLAPNPKGRRTCYTTMHVRRIDRESHVVATDGDSPVPTCKTASFHFYFTPKNIGDRKYINYFPYIGDDDGKLRLWDVDETRDIALSRWERSERGSIGLSAKNIKKRYPHLYALARSEGFWADS